MAELTYHRTETTVEGRSYRAGDVVRLFDGAFGDAVVLGFDGGGSYAKLARPYAYASSVGTTGPTVLVGTEIIAMYHVRHFVTMRVEQGRLTL